MRPLFAWAVGTGAVVDEDKVADAGVDTGFVVGVLVLKAVVEGVVDVLRIDKESDIVNILEPNGVAVGEAVIVP